MKEAYKIATEKSTSRKEKGKVRRKRKPPLTSLEIGERVLVKNVVERGGPGKIRSFWEQDIYLVKDKKGGERSLVYSIQKENDARNRIRVVHRNLLLPVSPIFQIRTETTPTNKRGEINM